MGFGPLGVVFGPLGVGFGPLGVVFGPLGVGFGPLGVVFGPLGVGLVLLEWVLVLSEWFLVLSEWFLVLSEWFLVPSEWFLVLSEWFSATLSSFRENPEMSLAPDMYSRPSDPTCLIFIFNEIHVFFFVEFFLDVRFSRVCGTSIQNTYSEIPLVGSVPSG